MEESFYSISTAKKGGSRKMHCEHARRRSHPTGVTETVGKKRIMKL
jgi:hypothetical protein